MAVQRAIKLLYKYALVHQTVFQSANNNGIIEIDGTSPVTDGYANLLGLSGKIVVTLSEDDSSVIKSPEFEDKIRTTLENSYIDQAQAGSLDSMGNTLGLIRYPGESDAMLRTRINAIFWSTHRK